MLSHPKWTVEIERTTTETVEITVTARSEEEAQSKAEKIAANKISLDWELMDQTYDTINSYENETDEPTDESEEEES